MAGRAEYPQGPPPGAGQARIAEGLRAGDPASLQSLLEAEWSLLVSYLARFVPEDPEAAEDIAQETFLRIWERRRVVDPSRSLRGLLYRTARNLALNWRRSTRARAGAEQGVESRLQGRLPDPSPLDITQRNEVLEVLERAVQTLPPRRREVFILAYFHDLSHKEIAATLGIRPQTVANQMSAALTTLREALRFLLG